LHGIGNFDFARVRDSVGAARSGTARFKLDRRVGTWNGGAVLRKISRCGVFRAPNGGVSIRIRGASTFLGSSEPLYIIDGTKVQSGSGGLLFLDPQEITRIEVLKDIGSTSIYGSEGANGVIIITTKRR